MTGGHLPRAHQDKWLDDVLTLTLRHMPNGLVLVALHRHVTLVLLLNTIYSGAILTTASIINICHITATKCY